MSAPERDEKSGRVDLSVLIVDTNELRVLAPCLKSVFEQTTGISFEVIVIDNASTDGSAEWLEREYPHVRVLRNASNLGFAGSNNRGIKIAQGEYVILLNPDTEVLDGALQKTVEFMGREGSIGIAGCRLLYPTGRTQESVRSFPSVWNLFCEATFLYLLFPRSKTIGRYYMSDFDFSKDQKVDWVSGAYFMIRRQLIEKIGILDERFFMYSEELEYCFRAREAGFSTWYFSGASTVHHWGGPRTTNRRLIFWAHKSQALFIKKHFRGFRRQLMLGFKYLGVALRVPVYFIAAIGTLNGKYLLKSWVCLRSVPKLLCNSPDW